MTREEIGRKIAELCGAYEDKNYHSMGGAMVLPKKSLDGRPIFLWHLKENVYSGENGWDPTCDILAAFQLVNGIPSDRFFVSLDRDHTRWLFFIGSNRANEDEYFQGEGETPEMAICNAWILWRENESDRNQTDLHD